MREVLGGKLQSRLAALKGGMTSEGDGQLGGSCMNLSTAGSMRPQTRSCSLETMLDDSAPLTRQQLFLSNDSLASYSNRSQDDGPAIAALHSRTDFPSASKAIPITYGNAQGGTTRNRLSVASAAGLSVTRRSHSLRPRSVGSCLDIVMETKEEDVKETKWRGRAASCLNVNTPAEPHHSSASRPPSWSSRHPPSSSYHPFLSSSHAMAKVQGSHATTAFSGPRPASSTSNLWTLPPPAVVRRCLSSLDVSKQSRPASLFKAPVCVPTSSSKPPQSQPEHSKTPSL